MAIVETILKWIREYEIKSLINAPCVSTDCDVFRQNGVSEVIGINILDTGPHHIQADLCVWKPEKAFDAAYINCIFCTSNGSIIGTHQTLAQNYATWPVRYLIVYDTAITPFDWAQEFIAAGWKRIDVLTENGGKLENGEWQTRCEIWSRTDAFK